jgi:hypothetical protein
MRALEDNHEPDTLTRNNIKSNHINLVTAWLMIFRKDTFLIKGVGHAVP